MRRVIAIALLLGSTSAAAESLTLDKLIELARANDLRVREAEADLRIFRGKYQEARWAWFPRIESTVAIAGPMPEARNDGLGGPPSTAATKMYDLDFGTPGVMFRAEAQALLPLYTFGKLTALEEAGEKLVDLGKALEVRARDEAQLQVTQAFWGYQLARAGRLTITGTTRQIGEARKALETLLQQKSDQVTQMDVYKLDYFVQQAQSKRYQAEAGERYALAAVRLIIGARPEHQVAIAPYDLVEPAGAPEPVERYLELAHEHRPELRAIDAGLAARQREVFIRERAFLPDFGILGFARWIWTTSATRQISPFAYDPYNDLNAGLALVARQTWDFPMKSAQLEQARGEVEKLEKQRALLKKSIDLDTEKAWAELVAAHQRVEAQALAERHARRWATAAMAAFELGTSDTQELTGSLAAVAQSGVEKAQAIHDVHVGYALLSRAVGIRVQPQIRLDAVPAPPPSLRPR